jgi:peptidyl-prolyl cis-trans isomerase D
MNFLRKYQVHVLAGLLAFFLLYIALGFGTSFFVKGSPNDAIVEVDGIKIPLRFYWSHYYRSLDTTKPLDEAGRNQKRDETIRDLVQEVVFKREVERYGVHTPDAQVAVSLTQIPAFQSNGRFDPQRYMQVITSQLRSTPQDFEEEQRVSIGYYKLRWMIQSAIKVTDKELELAEGYPEFAKTNRVEDTEVHDPKTGIVTGHKKRERTETEIRELFRKKLWEEKTLFSFNQWLNQVGQQLRVKTHFDVLEGGPQG